METEKKRSRLKLVLFLSIGIPVFLVVLAFCGLCLYVHSISDTIFPNVSVFDFDVSGLTREEALQAITERRLNDSEARWGATQVTVSFPRDMSFTISGEELRLRSDVEQAINSALSSGRGNGPVMDAISYIQRLIDESEGESFEVQFWFDTDALRSRTDEFALDYNDIFAGNTPRIYDDRIVFVAGAGQVGVSASDLYALVLEGMVESLTNGRPVEITYSLPQSAPNITELESILGELFVPPLSAEFDLETWTVTQCVVGVSFDLDAATSLLDEAVSGETVMIPIVHTPPEISREYLESLLFRDLIARSVTRVDGTTNRLTNITLAAEAVNGVVLQPGEEFSFNAVVGPRTTARGYRLAGAILNGEPSSTIGGGICQVASTMHDAVLNTGLLVTERRPHSRRVDYLPRGRDAAIFWGQIDYRFVNTMEFPLRIDVEIENRRLTVQLFSTILDD